MSINILSWKENATEVLSREKGFDEWYLGTVLRDTAAVTGFELCRRIVGMAQVKDITAIADENARTRAERICITAAKDYIKNRNSYKTGDEFLKNLKEASNKFLR